MHHSLFVVLLYEVEWEDLSLNQNMKRIKFVALVVIFIVIMLWNRDNAYDEVAVIPEVVEEHTNVLEQ